MNNEWLKVVWIMLDKGILHRQIMVNGKRIEVEQVLTKEQRNAYSSLLERQNREIQKLLREFVK